LVIETCQTLNKRASEFHGEILVSHGDEDVDVGLLVSNAMWTLELKMEATCSPKHWYLPTSPQGFNILKKNISICLCY
jgi:hypothetical protein